MARLSGSSQAVGEEVAEVVREAELEQLELLPPTRFDAGAEEPSERALHQAMVESVRRHGAGRPPGSRNLRTRQAVDYIRRVIGDPLIERARWALHTPESLARELNCSRLEAWDRLEKVRADLCTFMHPRLAPTDAAGNAVVPTFSMVVSAAAGRIDPEAPPWAYLENQALSGNGSGVSHGEVSHGDANALAEQDK